LRVLLTAKKSLMASGGAMSVVNANASVRSVFEITGCSELFGLA
jgi:anti-anti-sigma regulatory factor